MRRIALHFALPCIVMAMAAACSNEELNTAQPDNDGKFLITAGFSREAQTRALVESDAFNPTATTRVAYDDSKVGSTSESALTWQEGDMLEVSYTDESSTFRQLTYTLLPEDAGKATGRFTGNELVGTSSDGTYSVSYRAPGESSSDQQGDNDTSHLRKCLSGKISANSVTDLSQIPLAMNATIIKLVLTNLPTDLGTLTSFSWDMYQTGGGSGTACDVSGITIDEDHTSCTLYFSRPSYSVQAGGKIVITLRGDKTYTATKELTNGMTYEAGRRYTATIDNTFNTIQWVGNASYTLVDNLLTLDVTPGKLISLLEQVNMNEADNVSSINKVVVKGTLSDEDMAKVDDFNTTGKPNSSAISNWLRSTATAVTSLDMSQVTGLTTLPVQAFYGCATSALGNSSLNELLLPSSLRTIESNAFAFANPETLVLPEGVATIASSAFHMANIKKLIIPNTVTTLGNNSLKASYDAECYVLEGANTSILKANVFFNQSNISSISILLPDVAESTAAAQVRTNCTYNESYLEGDTYSLYPKIYYGWKGGDYASATTEDKFNTSNYTELY